MNKKLAKRFFTSHNEVAEKVNLYKKRHLSKVVNFKAKVIKK